MKKALRYSLEDDISEGLDDIVYEREPEKSEIPIDNWQDWIRLITPFKHLAEWHKQLWEWAWQIERGKSIRPFVAIAPRGGGKSSQCEQLIAALGARGQRKYVLYVRNSQELANSSITNIANILENSPIGNYYPAVTNKLVGRHGNQKGWTQKMLRTASGFNAVAFGVDSAIRGTKLDNIRPDFICHKIGTLILDDDIGRWMPVEYHPSFEKKFARMSRFSPGIRVSTSNAKYYHEIVTPEHRFHVRDKLNGEVGWVQAKDLIPERHQIGSRISQRQDNPPSVLTSICPNLDEFMSIPDTYKLQSHLLTGQGEIVYPKIMDDFPDLWMILGYYAVSGSCKYENNTICIYKKSGKQVKRSSDHLAIFESILKNARIPHRIQKTEGEASRLIFAHPVLSSLFSAIYSGTRFYEKRPLPAWIENLSNDRLKMFTNGIEMYAGYNPSKRPHSQCIVNQNVPLLISIQRVFAKLGIPTMMTSRSQHYRSGEMVYTMWLNAHRADNDYEDGWLWQLVSQVKDQHHVEFIPINTKSHTYHSALGMSHNCLDDMDQKHDKPHITRKKIETITETILPAGSTDATVLAVQNLIIPTGIFAKIADNSADFLLDRILSGPHKAIENLEYKYVNGQLKITRGQPLWEGQNIEVCEMQMKRWGIKSFLREAQHEVDVGSGGMFEDIKFQEIDPDEMPDLSRVICWVDPAMTSGEKSHSQAIQIDGLEKTEDQNAVGRIYRIYSWEGVSSPSDVIERALIRSCLFWAESIGFETNQGGSLWEESYQNIARKLMDEEKITYIPQYIGQYTRHGKEERASQMYDEYLHDKIIHVSGFSKPLEIALTRFPNLPDDLVDAAQMSWSYLRSTKTSKKKKSIRLNTAVFKKNNSTRESFERRTNRNELSKRLGIRSRL